MTAVIKTNPSNQELVENLAENVNDPEIRRQIEERIPWQSAQMADGIIRDFAYLVEEMASVDTDARHQNLLLRYREEKFAEIRSQLWDLMTEEPV